jgi:chromosome condensin MukBEF complex kleisin-like MukF subunit
MPAKKPRVSRIQITPTARLRDLLQELATLSNQSLSRVAAELLDEVVPVIQGQLDAMRAVASRPEQAAEAIQEYANKAINDVAQASMEFSRSEGKRRRKNAAS